MRQQYCAGSWRSIQCSENQCFWHWKYQRTSENEKSSKKEKEASLKLASASKKNEKRPRSKIEESTRKLIQEIKEDKSKKEPKNKSQRIGGVEYDCQGQRDILL